MKLKDFGATQLSAYRGKNKTQKQDNRTSYIFKHGYEPIIIGGSVLIDEGRLLLSLEFKSNKEQKAWREFEKNLDEMTFQTSLAMLIMASSNPFLLVNNVKTLMSSLLKVSEGFSTFLDASNGKIYNRTDVSRRFVPLDFD